MALIFMLMVLEWFLTKSLSLLIRKKTYKKHYRVKGILVDTLPYSEYINIINKSTVKTIFKSLCVTYEGN